MNNQSLLGKFLYGLLFVVLLPLLLFFWSSVLDRSIQWPVPNLPFVSLGAILLGGGVMLKGMIDLFVYGQGLPMNAYPPRKFVSQGIYAWFAHPIYLGAVVLSLGVSLWARSSSGLYIVTPTLALMALSLLYGYELPAMGKLFANSLGEYHPLFALPVSSENRASWIKKIALAIRIFLPWMVVGYLIDYARCAAGCSASAARLWELGPAQLGLDLLALIPYLYLVLRLLAARTERDLRHMAIAATLATVFGIYLNLILPVFGFNLINPKWSLIVIGIASVLMALSYRAIWSALQRSSEWVANSRHDWLFAQGNFRIINHGLYSGLAGAVGVGIGSYIISNHLAVLIAFLCVLIGAAVFAQVAWGSGALLRPFGYWGGILGGLTGTLLVCFFFRISISRFVLGAVLCAPFAQAFGRLRCLVQGCCHGLVTCNKDLGIRVWQPQSRVVVLSGLKGQYILNTQLYSILFNLILGLLLWSMWSSHRLSNTIIIAAYLILTGLERFVEDAYRGEKQTRMARGIRENQWVAFIAMLIGILVSFLPASLLASPEQSLGLSFWLTALAGGLVTSFLMSMDFPKSTKRFSRLSG
ncbi:MAG TPA: prolipoprotein diacylglyceryl transferase family protein [Anaerolineales bacterium]|nr:prolipoprotein diacylglyceryl transferase family protein [Anaerolineales bacterium]